MNVMRLNVVDAAGIVSFVGPSHAVKVLTAACAKNPNTLSELLDYAEPYDSQLKRWVLDGLAVFDEHHTEDDEDAVPASGTPELSSPFRVLGPITREASLQPVHTGLVIFNLPARRIVQVQNSYAHVQREDRGRVRRNGEPIARLYYYRLPKEWQVVP